MKLQFYPYTYVRTIVMKTKLLQKDDYDTLLKMGNEEMINYLQSKGYHEFAAASNAYKGIALVEHAVKAHMVAAFEKLRRVSGDDLRQVIDMYLLRYDLRNLKTIIRGIMFKQPVKDLIVPAGTLPRSFYEEMLTKELADALAMLRNTPFADIRHYPKKDSLFHLETKLDQLYYGLLFDFVQKLGNQSVLFKQFVMEEITMRNIITILKLLKDDHKADMQTVLLPYNGNRLIKKLSAASSLTEAIKQLEKSAYGKHIEQGIASLKATTSLVDMETDLRKLLLKKLKRQTHQNLLSVDVILDFLFEMDLEVKNILLIFKARTFGLDEQFVKENMII